MVPTDTRISTGTLRPDGQMTRGSARDDPGDGDREAPGTGPDGGENALTVGAAVSVRRSRTSDSGPRSRRRPPGGAGRALPTSEGPRAPACRPRPGWRCPPAQRGGIGAGGPVGRGHGDPDLRRHSFTSLRRMENSLGVPTPEGKNRPRSSRPETSSRSSSRTTPCARRTATSWSGSRTARWMSSSGGPRTRLPSGWRRASSPVGAFFGMGPVGGGRSRVLTGTHGHPRFHERPVQRCAWTSVGTPGRDGHARDRGFGSRTDRSEIPRSLGRAGRGFVGTAPLLALQEWGWRRQAPATAPPAAGARTQA